MSSGRSPWFYLFIAWIAALLTGAFVVATIREGEDFLIPATIAVGVITAILLKSSVGEALAMRLRGEVPSADLNEGVLAELDEVRSRLMELEERLDFSERLLSQTNSDPARIPAARQDAQ
ncbi:MAG: hypothetical protein M3Y31_04570 [Gemmatimonadota bacterium]|nr:hypothetical protein [Gemmatimonadota bacterium]